MSKNVQKRLKFLFFILCEHIQIIVWNIKCEHIPITESCVRKEKVSFAHESEPKKKIYCCEIIFDAKKGVFSNETLINSKVYETKAFKMFR